MLSKVCTTCKKTADSLLEVPVEAGLKPVVEHETRIEQVRSVMCNLVY